MSCQSSFAWKASPTRIPPPICTSAPGSQTALIWRAEGVADKQLNTPRGFSDNPWIRRMRRVFATVASLQRRNRESKVLNPCTESPMSQTTVQYQKYFINYLRLLSRRSIFQSLSSAMCISNSRSVIFHDYFCRVTPRLWRSSALFHLRCLARDHRRARRAKRRPVELRTGEA